VGGGAATLQDIAVAIIATVIVAGTVSLLLTALLSNPVTAPVVALRDAAERVGRGDFAARIPMTNDHSRPDGVINQLCRLRKR
jgi:nitrate/nitrite-specific signal transduction histidine kinase